MNNKNKIAMVIGSGGVRCAAALGFLRFLSQEDVEVDMIVANGTGSIFGSLFALGYSVEEIVEISQRLWTHNVINKPNRKSILQILLPKLFMRNEFFNLRADCQINDGLYKTFGELSFADTKIPLFITSTDYKSGEQVVLSEGSVYEAVRAAIGLPIIFPLTRKDKYLLADGYLSDPIPIGVAVREGANVILAMGFETMGRGQIKSIFDYILHMYEILSNNLFQASFSFHNLAHHAEIFSIMPQIEGVIRMFDMQRVPEMIEVGQSEGEKLLPRLKQFLKGAN